MTVSAVGADGSPGLDRAERRILRMVARRSDVGRQPTVGGLVDDGLVPASPNVALVGRSAVLEQLTQLTGLRAPAG